MTEERIAPIRSTSEPHPRRDSKPSLQSHSIEAVSAPVRVMIEQGKKKAVAAAFDWPGWERGSKSEDEALAVLATYRPRYARVAELAGLAADFRAAGKMKVVQRVTGVGMTDFYTLSLRPANAEKVPMSPTECNRKIALLRASWSYFDGVASRVSPELRKGPRGGGRERDEIVRHANVVEITDFAQKVGVNAPEDAWRNPDELRAYRDEFCEAIREYNARAASARTWTVQFLIRHSAYHMLDHAWEMEDRDLSSGT